MRAKSNHLVPIILLTFVNTIGFSLLIPVVPFIVAQYDQSAFMFGVLIATYSIFQLVAAPYLGALSDKYGRRPVLLASQLGTVISWGIFGLAYFVPHVPVGYTVLPIVIIMLSRVVDGITGGNVSVANAYVADISSAAHKAKNFGILGAVSGIGYILGPVLGGVSSESYGYIGTALLALALSLVTLFSMWRYLPESLAQENRSERVQVALWKEINIFARFREWAHDHFIRRLFFVRAFFYLAVSSTSTLTVLYANQQYDLTPLSFGLLFLFIGLAVILSQGVVIPRLTQRFGALPILRMGYLTLGAGLLFLMLEPSLMQFVLICLLIIFGFSASSPTFKALITNHVSARQQGQITGLDESLSAASNAVGPLLAGLIYAIIGTYAFGVFALYLVVPYVILYGVKVVWK